MKKLLIIAVVGLFSTLFAFAQNPGVVTQGAVTANNCVKFVNRNLIADAGAGCGGTTTFGNPTASVGLVAINGVATTAMRSDAAPALAQNITPTWTGQHVWVRGVSGYTPTNDAALEVAFDGDTYNATQLTSFSAANSVFDGPFILGRFAYGTPSSMTAVGDGAVLLGIGARGSTGSSFSSLTKALIQMQADGLWSASNNGTRIVLSTTLAGTTTRSDQVAVLNSGNLALKTTGAFSWSSTATPYASEQALLTSPAAAKIQLGATNVDTGPVNQTLQAQGVLASGTSNVSGANFTIASGQGKGNATGSSLIFQTPLAVASGVTAQTMTTALTLDGSQAGLFAGTVASTSAATGSVQTAGGIGVKKNSFFEANVTWGNNAGVANTAGAYLYNAGEFGWSSTSGASGTADLWITRAGAASIRIGQASAAAPITQTISVQGSRPGTDSNTGGGNLFITSGNGTGTGAISSLFLQSPVAVAAGVTVQTMTTGWTINKGVAASTGYTIANLPTSPLTGSIAYVTNQLTTCAVAGAALTAGGSVVCPVFYNGSAWVGN